MELGLGIAVGVGFILGFAYRAWMDGDLETFFIWIRIKMKGEIDE